MKTDPQAPCSPNDNRIQSSRRLERETQRSVELMWLTGRLTPDFKTIADFRNDTRASMKRRVARMDKHIERYLSLLDQADNEEPSSSELKMPELEEKIVALKAEMQRLKSVSVNYWRIRTNSFLIPTPIHA